MRHLPLLLALACACTPPDGNARFQVRESVEQVQVTHATPGAALSLVDGSGKSVQSGSADTLGSLIFRKVAPGDRYTVHVDAEGQVSRHFTVMSVASSLPSHDFYARQKLAAGSGYIRTRDGTTLSVYVTLPGPVEMGPYPTVVDYSGYEPSQPGAPVAGGKYSFLCDSLPTLCDAPNDPSALIASLFGYATVSVNIRGTGCSGGAYDYFERLELLDGYDVIETVAAQDWVLHHKVGMTGLSYPGISQLFVASTQPPSLAAITPLSVIGNSATTLVPGGILNDGFALEWVSSVLNKADPYGQGWEMARVQAGDHECAENQLLHGQKINNVAQAQDPAYYRADVLDALNPTLFADQIKVPVFLAGAWEDEQTGPFFTTLLDRFRGAPVVRETVYNGVHPDGFQPQVLIEWKNFLDLYVAQRVPVTQKSVRDLSPILFSQIYHSTNLRLPPDRFADAKSVDEARARFEAEPPLRVLFESGAADLTDVGAPGGTAEKRFSQWPPTETTPARYFLRADGSLSTATPTEPRAASSFLLDPLNGERGILEPGGDVFDKLPAYDWPALVQGNALSFETPALAQDALLLGTASADLWIASSADDADLQATVTEVRPDGQEVYVQSGWLRASFRALDPAASTALWPALSYHGTDEAPLVPGQYTQVRVPIAAFGHQFRAGSKIRVVIDTPGATRAAWRFALKKFAGPVTHTIGLDAAHPSSVVLPGLAASVATLTTAMPPCPSLRGQPCRAYAPITNPPAQ